MYIYLPIAEISVNAYLLLGLGGMVGVMSGLFGVGGGFLMTPLLIFLGIPPAVAVATESNQIVASSVSGVLAHWRRGNVDFKMGGILLFGGLIGSTFGVYIFSLLRQIGQVDLMISLCYVVFLGTVGCLMFFEGIKTLLWVRRGRIARRPHPPRWLKALPLKVRFRKSKLYISLFAPIGLGFIVGILSALMGVGGGFIIVPAMIYLLGMPTSVVIGTSLFQIIFVTANATFFQSYLNQTVDVFLALLLLLGGVIGAQIGTRLGDRLPGEKMRLMLAVIVLLVCGKLLFDLVIRPSNLYSLGVYIGG